MSENLMTLSRAGTLKQRAALRMLNALGWRLYFAPLPGRHGVAIVSPHTSNWDVAIDYPTRTIRADRVLHLSGDKARDRAAVAALYANVKGLVPENAAPIDW